MRIAIGNGVRTDVWSEFLSRFGDIKVKELYAATEGNIGFINYTSKIGAVGRVNPVHRVGGGTREVFLSHGCDVALGMKVSVRWSTTLVQTVVYPLLDG